MSEQTEAPKGLTQDGIEAEPVTLPRDILTAAKREVARIAEKDDGRVKRIREERDPKLMPSVERAMREDARDVAKWRKPGETMFEVPVRMPERFAYNYISREEIESIAKRVVDKMNLDAAVKGDATAEFVFDSVDAYRSFVRIYVRECKRTEDHAGRILPRVILERFTADKVDGTDRFDKIIDARAALKAALHISIPDRAAAPRPFPCFEVEFPEEVDPDNDLRDADIVEIAQTVVGELNVAAKLAGDREAEYYFKEAVSIKTIRERLFFDVRKRAGM